MAMESDIGVVMIYKQGIFDSRLSILNLDLLGQHLFTLK